MCDGIKTIILTGFLGSGKTTLLSYLLKHDQFKGKKVAVLVNEFGKIPIDGALLPKGDFYLSEIDKGSIFCVCVKTDLLRSLTEISRNYKPDVLIIEATGLAEPCDFTALLETDELKDAYDKAATICVADSINLPKLVGMMPAVKAQVQVADIIILNKTDLVDEEHTTKLTAQVKEINPSAQIIPAVQSNIPLNEIDILSPRDAFSCTSPELCKPKIKAPDSTSTCELTTNESINKQLFYEVMDKYRNNILRGKGIVSFDAGEMYVEVINGVVTSKLPGDLKLPGNKKSNMVFILRDLDENIFLRDCNAFINGEQKSDEPKKRLLSKFFPRFTELLDEMDELYKQERPIDEKTYQFLCYALSIKGRSKPCVLKHYKGALDAGATEEELAYILALTMREAAGADDCWTHDVLKDASSYDSSTGDCCGGDC